jgi:peroxiredoxin
LQQQQNGINILNEYKPVMSNYIYQLYRADMTFRLLNFKKAKDLRQIRYYVENNDTARIAQFKRDYQSNTRVLDTASIPNEVLYHSAAYLHYRYSDCKVRSFNSAGSYAGKVLFNEVKRINDWGLRDRLFVIYFIHSWINLRENFDNFLKEAILNTTDGVCLNKLKAYLHNRNGQVAYNFALQDKDGKVVKLSDFKGKAVFIDFYFTGCVFCKLFYKYVLSEIEPKYVANPNIVFISVSTDRYKAEWLKTLQQGEYTSKNSINLYTNGEKLNHPLIKYYNILSYPALMLIDRRGRIFKFASNEMRSKRGLEEALNAVLEIK